MLLLPAYLHLLRLLHWTSHKLQLTYIYCSRYWNIFRINIMLCLILFLCYVPPTIVNFVVSGSSVMVGLALNSYHLLFITKDIDDMEYRLTWKDITHVYPGIFIQDHHKKIYSTKKINNSTNYPEYSTGNRTILLEFYHFTALT